MKNKLFKLTIILLGLSFLLTSFSTPPEDIVEQKKEDVYAPKTIVKSELTKDNIEDYKAKKEYDYFNQNQKVPQKAKKQTRRNNWDWFDDFLDLNWSNIKYILIALFILIVILVSLSIAKSNRGVFNRNKVISSDDGDVGEIDEETIEENDFDKMLEKAKSLENYRLVLRLLFLQSLQMLNDKELIKYKKNKTNYEYSFEIKNKAILNEFNKTSDLFAWVWYGNTKIEQDVFEKIEPAFKNLIKTIEK